jgi:hypothetical protein
LARFVALLERHGAAGESEGVGEEFAELLIRPAFECGGVNFDF